jgi:hypothetical protein
MEKRNLKELIKLMKKKKQKVKQDTALKNKIYNRKLFFRLVIVLIDIFFPKTNETKNQIERPKFFGKPNFF